jgi:hypothetical protein
MQAEDVGELKAEDEESDDEDNHPPADYEHRSLNLRFGFT